MKIQRTYLVKQLSRIACVSVRTLHHYDEIGLLVPATRTLAGYRLYDDDDLLRLQQILIGRELGLPLEEIRKSLDDPSFDQKKALLEQREQLQKRMQSVSGMIHGIDKALAILIERDKGNKGEAIDMKDIFDGFDPSKFESEASDRWGQTDNYKESVRRTKKLTAEDWKRLKTEQDAIYRDAAEAMISGKSPDLNDVMDIADRHRLFIDRWFYPCDLIMHGHLADTYESDSRFGETIDKYGPGLTAFLVEAIRANARRNGRQ